jgi:hypothetical protein
MRYKVDENNAVWGYVPTQEEACLFQPNYPDGSPFKDKADAEAWGAAWVANFSDPENNPEPPSSPEI